MRFLQVSDLVKSFGDRTVLSGLTFGIERSEVYGLVGPNGAGKTTTINVLCSVLAPDRGGVYLDGVPVTDAARRRLGVATQEISLYADLTCRQNLSFFATVYGRSGLARSTRVNDCLSAVGLEERGDTLVSELSGGMRRRLHVGVAMLHEPELLVLDEPTVGLDLESRRQLWDLIRALASAGSTVLVTTHQLEEAEALCHRIGILQTGRLVAEGTMDELRRHIPAAELAVISAPDLDRVCRRAAELGFQFRRSLTSVSVWLPERYSLERVAGDFGGVALTSLALKPVGLEEIFAEVTDTARS